ncbi:hypothetical protein AAG906_013098 [Vitis piasezkii]
MPGMKLTDSMVHDDAQIYDIKSRISTTKQGNCSITEYSNILHNLWQELDHYQCIEMKCSEDATILKKFMEKDRIYTFLAGLNAEFDIVRVQVLGKEDLPSLNETIGIIQGEESRRRVMLEPQPVESSAMVLRGANARSGGADHQPSTYCSGVTNESSWSEDYAELDRVEIEKLKFFLGTLEKPTGSSTCSLAFSVLALVIKTYLQQMDQGMGNMIGLARGRNGLYYLEFDGQSSILDHKTPTQVLESEPNLSADDRTKGIEIISNSEAYEKDVFDPKPRDDYDLPIAIRKVAKMKTVRILLSLTISRGWSMQQYDVKNTFLHGDLDEEIYMEVPLGFESESNKLKYKQGQGDHTLFVKHSASREFLPLETPIEQNHKLCEAAEDTVVDRESYQWVVSRLIYLSHTRPHIAYAVGVVSRHLKELWEKEYYSRKEKS